MITKKTLDRLEAEAAKAKADLDAANAVCKKKQDRFNRKKFILNDEINRAAEETVIWYASTHEVHLDDNPECDEVVLPDHMGILTEEIVVKKLRDGKEYIFAMPCGDYCDQLYVIQIPFELVYDKELRLKYEADEADRRARKKAAKEGKERAMLKMLKEKYEGAS